MEAVGARASAALEDVIKEAEERYIRTLQAKAYRCCAQCCENRSITGISVQNCVNNCANDVNRAQELCNQEITNFQGRIDRCALDCQDKIKDKFSRDMTESQVAALTKEMEHCVIECIDTRIKFLAKMRKRLAGQLESMLEKS